MRQQTLESLGLSTPELAKIRSLGIDSLDALQAMMQATPEDLRRFLGPDTFSRIANLLDSAHIVPLVGAFDPSAVGLGARLERTPAPAAPRVDVTLRDRLFSELTQLKNTGDPRHQERILELTRDLHELLKDDG